MKSLPCPPKQPLERGAQRRGQILAAFIIVSFIAAGCSDGRKSGQAEPVLVEIKRAEAVASQDEILATGSFRREKEVDLSFRIGGVLREINYREGQLIEKGSVVASIDPTQVEAQIVQAQAQAMQASAGIGQAVEQARAATSSIASARAGQAQAEANAGRAAAAVAQARADLANAQRDYERDAALAQKGYVSEARLDTRKTRMDVAEASLRSAEAGLNAARQAALAANAGINQAEAGAGAAQAGVQAASGRARAAQAVVAAAAFDRRWARLISPIRGIVLTRSAEPGEIAAPGQSILVVADEESPLILRTPVSDKDVARIQVGDGADVYVSAIGRNLKGVVTRVAQRADPRTGAFDIDIAVDNAGEIKTGFFADARIRSKTASSQQARTNEVLVPTEALIGVNGNKATLFVLNSDQKTVRLATVDFIRLQGNQALVRGIPIGTGVVTSGGAYVANKALVKVVEARP